MSEFDEDWPNASQDLEAVGEIERRLAQAAGKGRPVPYSKLVSDVLFQLEGKKDAYRINTFDWSGQDRGLIGEYLGYLSAITYERYGFMASSIAVDSKEMRPSKSFYDLAIELGAYDGRQSREEFWVGELNTAFEHYNKHAASVGEDLLPEESDFIEYARDVIEGAVTERSASVRKRCSRLLDRAKDHYRADDGILSCKVCGWAKPSDEIQGDIVEMHHSNPLADAPVGGRKMSLNEAIALLTPLCPNCHRMVHGKAGGGIFSPDELLRLIEKRAMSPYANG